METDFLSTPSKRIALLCKERGVKQKDLAKVLDKSTSFISQVFQGERNFIPEDYARLAQFLGVTTDWLLMVPDAPLTWTEKADEVHYFSRQADAIAQLVDSVPPNKRDEMLAVVETMANSVAQARLSVGEATERLRGVLRTSGLTLQPRTIRDLEAILLAFALGTGDTSEPEA